MKTTMDRREFVKLAAAAGIAAAFPFPQNTAPGPDASERDLVLLGLDAVKTAGIVREPLLPVRQNLPDLVDDCATCRGKRYVRRDLPITHPDFGKAVRCPHCR